MKLVENRTVFVRIGIYSCLAFLLAACSDSKPVASLESDLKPIVDKLLPVARLLSERKDGSIIDLRDTPPRVVPDEILFNISNEQILTLQNFDIAFARYDGTYQSVLFELSGKGAAVSDVSSGYIYNSTGHFGNDVELVSDVVESFEYKKSKLQKNESFDMMLVTKVDANWGVYLKTF